MASEGLHEPADAIGPETVDMHRAISSVMEELEAIDWYEQRARATDDTELRALLEHNRDEEKEHAVMVLEWLRRRDPVLDRHMHTYLFSEGPIIEVERAAERGDADGATTRGELGIGSLREAERA
ncbi:MAG: encapsulin-associated ferritin-like protein [Acidimicrobiia bacterium]